MSPLWGWDDVVQPSELSPSFPLVPPALRGRGHRSAMAATKALFLSLPERVPMFIVWAVKHNIRQASLLVVVVVADGAAGACR